MIDPGQSAAAASRRAADHYTELAALAGGLAHEIKNPLSTIRLNMELLGEDFAEQPGTQQPPRERRALGKIQLVQSECLRLENLLDDFLRFARLGRLDLQPADLNAELTRALDFFQPKAAASGIDLMRYLDPELPLVQLDREPFQAALLNLLLNAQQAMTAERAGSGSRETSADPAARSGSRKTSEVGRATSATKNGGQLVIRTREAPGLVLLDLIDTGGGIEPAVQAKMFEPFYSTKPGGSGLGLPTVKRIVEAHGGKLAIESELGRGTKVTIVLPVPQRLAAKTASADETLEP